MIIFSINLTPDEEKKMLKKGIGNIVRFLGRKNFSMDGDIPTRQQSGSDCGYHTINNIFECCRRKPIFISRDVISGDYKFSLFDR